MLGLGLRQVQEALNKKADEIQHEFVAISDELEVVSRKLLEVRNEDRPPLRAEQEALRAKQVELADEVNLWRERARAVTQQRGETGLRKYLAELKDLGDPVVTFAADQAIESLDAPEEALARMQADQDFVGADARHAPAAARSQGVRLARQRRRARGSGRPSSLPTGAASPRTTGPSKRSKPG